MLPAGQAEFSWSGFRGRSYVRRAEGRPRWSPERPVRRVLFSVRGSWRGGVDGGGLYGSQSAWLPVQLVLSGLAGNSGHAQKCKEVYIPPVPLRSYESTQGPLTSPGQRNALKARGERAGGASAGVRISHMHREESSWAKRQRSRPSSALRRWQ